MLRALIAAPVRALLVQPSTVAGSRSRIAVVTSRAGDLNVAAEVFTEAGLHTCCVLVGALFPSAEFTSSSFQCRSHIISTR